MKMSAPDNNRLGKLKSRFSTNQISRYLLLLIGIICLGGGLYFVIKPFLDTKEPVILIVVPAIGLGVCVLGAFILRKFWQSRGRQIELYENGLIANLNGKLHSASWSEIASLTESIEAYYLNGVHTSDRYLYTIEKTDGDSFSFDNIIFQTKHIGQEIKEKTFELMYPPVLQKLKRGEKIHFGSLSIDSNGLSAGSERFLWTSLAAAELKDGMIRVKDVNGKIIAERIYAAVPNAHILTALLKEFITVE